MYFSSAVAIHYIITISFVALNLSAVDDSENSIPVIIGAAVGGTVLLFVTVTFVCIIVARRHKR